MILSAYSGDHTYTLPTTASVGDRCGVATADGNATYEILIKTGAAGDLLNGVDYSTNEWSRLFIAGETVTVVCVDAAGPHWIVEEDGRKPCFGRMYNSTTWTSTATSTDQQMVLDTIKNQTGDVCDTANNRMIIRRAGDYFVKAQASFSASGSGKFIILSVWAGSTAASMTPPVYGKSFCANTGANIGNVSDVVRLIAGDEVEIWVQQDDSTSEAISLNIFTISEKL